MERERKTGLPWAYMQTARAVDFFDTIFAPHFNNPIPCPGERIISLAAG
jgi:hypothetical protein